MADADPRRSLALAHLTAIELSAPELIEAAAAGGFDAVTLRLLPPGPREQLSPLVTERPRLDDAVSRLRHHGLGVLDVEALRLSGALDLDSILPALEAAAALGARHLLVVGQEADEPRLAAALHELCERAAPLGIRPMLEFIPFTPVATLDRAVAVVTAAAHPAAGVLVDPLHLRRSGGSPSQVLTLARSRPELLPYAQLCDAPLGAPEDGPRGLYREAVRDRRLPGDGELPLRELLAALPAGVPLSVETPVESLPALPGRERVAGIAQAVRTWLSDGERRAPD
jgi:sugar phosphate isomerase/epimerase